MMLGFIPVATNIRKKMAEKEISSNFLFIKIDHAQPKNKKDML
jgi:hypothetical protein